MRKIRTRKVKRKLSKKQKGGTRSRSRRAFHDEARRRPERELPKRKQSRRRERVKWRNHDPEQYRGRHEEERVRPAPPQPRRPGPGSGRSAGRGSRSTNSDPHGLRERRDHWAYHSGSAPYERVHYPDSYHRDLLEHGYRNPTVAGSDRAALNQSRSLSGQQARARDQGHRAHLEQLKKGFIETHVLEPLLTAGLVNDRQKRILERQILYTAGGGVQPIEYIMSVCEGLYEILQGESPGYFTPDSISEMKEDAARIARAESGEPESEYSGVPGASRSPAQRASRHEALAQGSRASDRYNTIKDCYNMCETPGGVIDLEELDLVEGVPISEDEDMVKFGKELRKSGLVVRFFRDPTWDMYEDENGELYYIHRDTEEISFQSPVVVTKTYDSSWEGLEKFKNSVKILKYIDRVKQEEGDKMLCFITGARIFYKQGVIVEHKFDEDLHKSLFEGTMGSNGRRNDSLEDVSKKDMGKAGQFVMSLEKKLLEMIYCLHQVGLYNIDLKPENLLLREDKNKKGERIAVLSMTDVEALMIKNDPNPGELATTFTPLWGGEGTRALAMEGGGRVEEDVLEDIETSGMAGTMITVLCAVLGRPAWNTLVRLIGDIRAANPNNHHPGPELYYKTVQTHKKLLYNLEQIIYGMMWDYRNYINPDVFYSVLLMFNGQLNPEQRYSQIIEQIQTEKRRGEKQWGNKFLDKDYTELETLETDLIVKIEKELGHSIRRGQRHGSGRGQSRARGRGGHQWRRPRPHVRR